MNKKRRERLKRAIALLEKVQLIINDSESIGKAIDAIRQAIIMR